MKSEFTMAINQICSERSLPQEVIYEAIETALVSAYKRNYNSTANVKAVIDMRTGQPQVFEERIVVDQVEDDRIEISLGEARRTDPGVQVGELVQKDVTPKSFGRIAAQTAKQVILQRIREAERDALFTSYADREGELINGLVASVTAQAVTLNLGRTEATMPRNQQVPGERYRVGQRIRAYVMEVRRTSRGPQIVVSRTHRSMLRRLLELEVPEIFNGTVEIKSIAREAGNRSKVAVSALQEGVDPVGSCVGIRGMRIQSIVNELGGEKIDVVEWSGDPSKFIANALSPAKVSYVVLGDTNAHGKTATVIVPDDQLSLAIGKEGQNARLAAKLTGWRIDIKSASEAAQEKIKPSEPKTMAAPGTKEKDLLAMAEAILLGKAPAPAAKAEVTEPEPEPEGTVDAEAETEETSPLLATAEALLRQQEAPAAEAEPEPAVVEAEPEPAVAEAEPEPALAEEAAVLDEAEPVVAVPQVPEIEEEPEPEAELEVPEEEEEEKAPVAAPAAERPRYKYVQDEEMDMVVEGGKKRGRGKKRQLVLDEKTGKLVSRRQHKRRSGSDVEWEDSDY